MTAQALRPLMLVLAGLTAGAAVVKGVSLAAPLPERQAPAFLTLPGYRVIALATSPGRRGRDLSHGPIRRFQLQPIAGGPAQRLLLVPVRGRNIEDVQLARLPAVVPELELSQRRLRTLQRADRLSTPPADQLALGRGPADPPGTITRLQTCVTPGGSMGVTEQTLAQQMRGERNAALLPSPKRFKRQSKLLQIKTKSA